MEKTAWRVSSSDDVAVVLQNVEPDETVVCEGKTLRRSSYPTGT